MLSRVEPARPRRHRSQKAVKLRARRPAEAPPGPEPAEATLATPALALRRCRTCGEEFPSDYAVCPLDSTPLGVDRELEDPLLGVILAGTYRIQRTLGRGGMGRLYEAAHARLDRMFAIKVLHEGHSLSKDAVRRFDREARALSRIRSDHVLDVVDVLRTPDDRTAIVTARLEGEDLKARLDRVGKMSVAEAIPLARQVCRGLAAAHAEGVIHRDLKPSNLFLSCGADGRTTVKILDFGVAKLKDDGELTRTGAVVGTPAYMAPEQARTSASVDERADVYAVGAVLYRMLTGRGPYTGDEPAQLLTSLLHDAPPRPRSIEPSIPLGLEVVLQRAMSRDPAGRPASVLVLDEELGAFDTASPPSAWAPPSEDQGTLILPRGSLERADALAKRAARARPLAVALAALTSLGVGAAVALITVGIQTIDGVARTAIERSAAWLLACAAAIAALSLLSRWIGQRWVSAPEVLRVDRTLTIALLSGATAMGVLALARAAYDALAIAPSASLGPASIVEGCTVAILGAVAGILAHRRAR
ncbi:MAG: serine/threonine-protein kinase [Sandaracinaceae bacterium]